MEHLNGILKLVDNEFGAIEQNGKFRSREEIESVYKLIDIAKDIAVKEEIPDVRKRDMLSEKTGLNINNAIMVNKVMNAEDEETEDYHWRRRTQYHHSCQESDQGWCQGE